MASSYSKFTFDDLAELGISVKEKLIFNPAPIEPSEFLEKILAMNLRRPMGTEKAKSELIVTPILNELVDRNQDLFTFYSGYKFEVDKKHGLNGHVDFILSKNELSPMIQAPVFCIVEAKNGEIESGYAQCVAEMYAAFTFNVAKSQPREFIFGAVTTGRNWQFLRLQHLDCILDTEIYSLSDRPRLLGMLQFIVDQYK